VNCPWRAKDSAEGSSVAAAAVGNGIRSAAADSTTVAPASFRIIAPAKELLALTLRCS
jgi:hypothetical protein